MATFLIAGIGEEIEDRSFVVLLEDGNWLGRSLSNIEVCCMVENKECRWYLRAKEIIISDKEGGYFNPVNNAIMPPDVM